MSSITTARVDESADLRGLVHIHLAVFPDFFEVLNADGVFRGVLHGVPPGWIE